MIFTHQLHVLAALFTVWWCHNRLTLWPIDNIWWHRSGSTLAQVIACCLMAPSHYLNQCWLIIISDVQWQSPRAISQEIPQPSIKKMWLKVTYPKFHSTLPGANELYSCDISTWRVTSNSSGIIISPVSEGLGDVMVLRRSRPPPAMVLTR